MKKLLIASVFAFAATQTFAQSAPAMNPDTIEAGTAASGGAMVVPILMIVLMAAVVAGGGGSNALPMVKVAQ